MEPIATVRNATQTVKEFASKQEGQLARIEALVTACCILVGVLVLSNSRRRHESRSIPRLVIWAAFMFNYPVISYTVGLMQSSSIKNELFVVWACFLLLLLGSADTMTAFNFDDSSRQTRSTMNQGLHVIYLLLLILYYKGQLRHNFVISLFLLWALSVVRLGLRAWAYRSTCRSRGLVRENQIVHEYMKYEPLHSDDITGGTYDPKTMKRYIYLVDGKEEERVKNGEEVIEVAYRVPLKGQGPDYVAPPFTVPRETVDVDRVWQCKGKLIGLGNGGSSNLGASRRRDLCLSFALFRLLRLRFAADHVGDINLPFQRDKCREFVVDGLLSDDQDLDRAFRVVETELAFMFDFFYARYPSIKDTLAPDVIVYAAILATSLFTLFSPDLMRYQPAQGGANILIGSFNFDLLITRLVILWYIFIESYQFLAYFIFSDWHKVKMLCRYVRNESWHDRWLVEIPLKSMDAFLFTKSIALDDEVRHAVLRQLKRCKGKITDGRMSLRRIGVYDDDVLLGHTYARYILIWHVATSICSYDLDMENASEEVKKNHRVATKLSGYCMYHVPAGLPAGPDPR
ncbi:unnamed protein product [Urochloa decumbens]|uniref:DUF4220 domain-containing protein n=1 Tax=Urochloa decumbens TaxID=240449 RepID=A0ABC8Z0S2_9POAL